uniref:RNA-directed DNA polymerase n=1 Tax=Cajanus cajan TaxID=3821 RepID=A0A151UBJ4_CAJCA|nr:Transposon Ty3-I Gag-Pol polyprotein [Cajanus cajan]
MRVTGLFKKKPLHILIDSGSTHNFLDVHLAKKLGCEISSMDPLSVTVADGARVQINSMVKGFSWLLHNAFFKSDMLLLPLGCCDMVLGIEWLITLGDITWNFEKLTMEFMVNGRRLVLRGTTGEGVLLHSLSTHADSIAVPNNIEKLLLDFEDVFQEPTTLPPKRAEHDHRIPLVQGTNPVNKRPYRYAKQQKDIIDGLIREYLKSGIIQNSSSSYSSPVVLVGKKDGGWRLCIDYRELNKGTVKNRFPIPLVDDLLDELHGSKIFSKLDLRSGYNQVRVADEDVHKTAFKTHSGHYEYLVMPFGLTNAPATFQGLMNTVFQEFLRKFVLIFFDDILVYSTCLEDHLVHLYQVLSIMRNHSLLAKKSKCYFGVTKVEYLGHFITEKGVATDPAKIIAVQQWPLPQSVKQLRGFLGLAGYYRRFVNRYSTIARPLHDMLKKDGFSWLEEAKCAFQKLKTQLSNTPVLALPNFSKEFVLEVDASGQGVGAVLMQDRHPIAYISRSFNQQQQALSTYEKELLGVMFAVQKWRHYLLPKKFTIRTDHQSLKYILDQRLSTAFQQKWLIKLMEFDFNIEYKQGRENVAADALSRMNCSALLVHQATSELLNSIKNTWQADVNLQRIIMELQADNASHKQFSWQRGELRRKGKLVVGKDQEVRRQILVWLHASACGGHSGRDSTLHRVKSVVYWKGMTKDVRRFVQQCQVCQRSKYDTTASPGLLQPLPIPDHVWQHITMDFIEGLPNSFGKQVIFVVVDRLSKAAHFMALQHPYTAATVAQCFLDNVFKLHRYEYGYTRYPTRTGMEMKITYPTGTGRGGQKKLN